MKVIFVEIKKDEYIFNLKLEKEEIAYLFKLAIAEYKYYLETYIFHSKNNDNEKGHFLLGLIIKLRNKYWELTEK